MPRSIDRIVSWHVMLVSNPLTQISLPFVQYTSPLLVGISAFDGIGNAQMITRNNFQTMRKQYNRLISAVWHSGAEWQKIRNANGNGNYCDKQCRCRIKVKKSRVCVNGWSDPVSTVLLSRSLQKFTQIFQNYDYSRKNAISNRQHRPVIRIAGFFYKLCTLVASSFIASLAACRVICTGSVRGWCTPHCPSYREIVCFEFTTDIGCTLLVLAQFASVYSRTNSASRTNSTPVHSRTLIFANMW